MDKLKDDRDERLLLDDDDNADNVVGPVFVILLVVGAMAKQATVVVRWYS